MTSLHEEGRLKLLYDTLGYAAVGVPYSYYKDTISQKKEHQSVCNALKNGPRFDPYPKHEGREAKIKEHTRETNLQVGNRLSRLLFGKSLADAENRMTEPFVSSVLDFCLDSLPSGVDPTTFFQTIGVPDSDAAYGNFKQAMVASVMASWKAYNNKQTVTSLDTEHLKEYFHKRLGEELKLNWGSLLGTGSSKQMFTMSKLATPATESVGSVASKPSPVVDSIPTIRKLIPSEVRSFNPVDCHLLLDKYHRHKSHKRSKSSDEDSDTYSDEGSSSSAESSSEEEEEAPAVKAPAISPISTAPAPVSDLPSAEPNEVRTSAPSPSISLEILRNYVRDHPDFLTSVKNPTFFVPSDRVWNSYKDPNIVASVSARPLGFLSTHIASKVAPGHFVTVSKKTVRMSDGGVGSAAGGGSTPVLTEPPNLQRPRAMSVSVVNIAGANVTLVQIDQALPK